MTYKLPMARIFNVRDHGAKGDGTDDTAAFQAAITAAIASGQTATLLIPPPKVGSYYSIRNTLTIRSSTDAFCRMHIHSLAGFLSIRWEGSSNTAVFRGVGWKSSQIHNVSVGVTGVSGVTGWDIDCEDSPLGGYESTTSLCFTNCDVSFYSTTDGRGWRIGHTSGGVADIAFLRFDTCYVASDAATAAAANTAGHIGWTNEDPNGLAYLLINCVGQALQKFFTTSSTSGATYPNGSGHHSFYGCSGQNTYIAYEFTMAARYSVNGGRWEHGDIFCNAGGAGTQGRYAIQFDGVSVDNYSPTGYVICCGTNLGVGSFQVRLVGCEFIANSGVFGAFIDLETNSPGVSSLLVDGCLIRGTEPIYATAGTGQFAIDIRPTNAKVNSSNAVTGLIESTQPIKEGIRSGVATLVAGTVTVSTTAVATTSRIRISPQNSSGTAGELTVSARTAGTSFVITSLNAADTRTVFWEIVDPY